MPPVLTVRGLRDVQAGFKNAEKDVRLGLRRGLRQVAEPVAAEAERLAMSQIRRVPRSPRWSKMRIGVTRTLVYVAPRQKGTRGRGDPRRRGQGFATPDFGTLLMDRAMQPALDRHTTEIVRGFEELLDHMADNFNRGGIRL